MKGKIIMMKKSGFTLAEVLITLGIIGVVAAMTIPTLMNQTGQAQFKTGFKKMISVLNQAVTMNLALNNSDFSAMNTTLTDTASQSLFALFSNRMNILSTVSGATATTGLGSASNYTLFFNDGMAISWPIAATSCTSGSATSACRAVVDVNGIQRPNSLTTSTTLMDQFPVLLQNGQVLPNSTTARSVMYGSV